MAAAKHKRRKHRRSPQPPRFASLYRQGARHRLFNRLNPIEAEYAVEPDKPVVLEPIECEITFEPLPDPLLDALPEPDRERRDELAARVHSGRGAGAAEELERLRDKYPHIPKLWNHLMVAYQDLGRFDEAYRTIEESFRRFPDYLFALTNYCLLCLSRGSVDEVEALLGKKLHVKLMYPHRNVFHVSEFIAFTGMVSEFLCVTGRPDAARTHLEMLQELAPVHPITHHVERLLDEGEEGTRLIGAIRRLMGGGGLPGR